MSAVLTGAEFKKQLRAGTPKRGLFLNSHSPTVAEQLAHSGYDWLLVDTQHGPMGNESLSGMLAGINTADEARAATSCCRYPTAGTRSVYFPQRSMNKGGLLGYAGAANDNIICALQVETASCIEHMAEI